MRGKILIVEDDSLIADMMKRYLEREGFKVFWEENGTDALTTYDKVSPDVVVLDLMLPDMDGFDLCKVFSQNDTMVIILTAKDGDEDKIVGLELGADDYMTKPFNMRELVARVKALIRRKDKLARTGGVVRVGAFEIRDDERSIHLKGKPLDLTPKEFLILRKLLLRRGKVVSREELVADLYDREPPEYERIVDTYIYRLRTKIMEVDRSSSERIKTVRGFGYKVE